MSVEKLLKQTVKNHKHQLDGSMMSMVNFWLYKSDNMAIKVTETPLGELSVYIYIRKISGVIIHRKYKSFKSVLRYLPKLVEAALKEADKAFEGEKRRIGQAQAALASECIKFQ